jgi:hypothetical protein
MISARSGSRGIRSRSVGGAAGAPASGIAAPRPGAPGLDAPGPVAPPPIAASAVWQDGETSAWLRSRHMSASRPPGCTPERQAARIALVCFAVGRFGAAALRGGAGGAAGAGMVIAAGGGGAAGGAVTGGAAATGGVAPAGPRTTFWQAGESSAALARRHSRSSGLPGWIQEQCDMKSLIVQACWTAASSSCADGREGCGGVAAAAAGCCASGLVSVSALGAATAPTALLHRTGHCCRQHQYGERRDCSDAQARRQAVTQEHVGASRGPGRRGCTQAQPALPG